MARGVSHLTKPLQTPNTEKCNHGSHTAGEKIRREKGNNPDRRLRSQNHKLSVKRGGKAQTARRLAWKQPSFKESVTAHWSSRPARKM